MYQVTVTIGRNYGVEHARTGQPMTGGAWIDFRRQVEEDIVAALGAPVLAEWKTGEGFWQGVREESATITALYETTPEWVSLRSLRIALRVDKVAWWQDAIALSLGESELI